MDIMKQQFLPASLVQTLTTTGDEMILLDLQTDRFLGLDQMGAFIWNLLMTGSTPEEVVRQIAEQYLLEGEEFPQRDVIQFIQTMEAQHLLLPLQRASIKRGRPARSHALRFLRDWPLELLPLIRVLCLKRQVSEWGEAWLLLRWIHLFLRHERLKDLTNRWHRYPVGKTVSSEQVTVRRLVKQVQSAAAWHPFKAACLHQNLALGFLLRQRGIQADLVIGVSTYPFFAHAWLKSGTEIIQWQIGLGRGATLDRLESLSPIFSTEWFSHDRACHGGDV